jgi:archaellin
MKLEKKTKRLIALATIALIAFTAIVYAVIVWEYTTQITVLEPFSVETNLQPTFEVYPGEPKSYWINVTNNAKEVFNATLHYTVTAENCTVSITPENGASYTVDADATVPIPVEITVTINGDTPGKATIDWWIERTSP